MPRLHRQPPRPNCRPKSRFHFAFISPPPRSFPLFRRRSSIAPPTRPTHPKSGYPHPAPSTPRPPQRIAFAHFTRFFNRFDFGTSVSAFHLRSPYFLRPHSFFSAAALTFSAAAAPTPCVRSTLRLAPTADLIRPFRRRNPPRPAAPFCHHSPTRLRPLPAPPWNTAKSGGGHSPTLASLARLS